MLQYMLEKQSWKKIGTAYKHLSLDTKKQKTKKKDNETIILLDYINYSVQVYNIAQKIFNNKILC